MAGLVPAISIRKSAALQMIEITGTRPVMTGEELVAHFRPDSQDEGLWDVPSYGTTTTRVPTLT